MRPLLKTLDEKYPNSLRAEDFNSALSALDTKNFDKRNKYSKEFLAYLQKNDITDIYRVANPNSKVYTWNNKNNKSRIDFWLCDELFITNISNARIKKAIQTDHKLITISVITNSKNWGRGLWKLNTSFLTDKTFYICR